MRRQQYVMGNWKMNASLSSVPQLLKGLTEQQTLFKHAHVIVFPPAIYIQTTQTCLHGTSLKWGAQNVYPAVKGAFTGEHSGPMLQEFGCQFVLVGHSERRQIFKEDSEFVAQKFCHVKECGMMPVFCVGETLLERQDGRTELIIKEQLSAIYAQGLSFANSIVAYEPVWAIGTGKTPTPAEVQDVHHLIREFVEKKEPTVAASLSIIYGGSVTPENAAELFALSDVDGGLVGGASLKADLFLDIIKCIN